MSQRIRNITQRIRNITEPLNENTLNYYSILFDGAAALSVLMQKNFLL